MNNNIKFAVVGLCVLGLSSCMIMNDTTSASLNYPAYHTYDNNQYYLQNTYNMPNTNYKYDNYKYNEAYQTKQDILGSDSSPVSEARTPVSFHDRDHSWVSSQNPQAYTIELSEGEKASQVAQKLYKAPKSEKMAQVKYQQNGKNYYRGVYGSYNSAAEAQKALDALPPEIKNGASIKNWGSVQH